MALRLLTPASGRTTVPVVEHLTALQPPIGTVFRFFAVPGKVGGLGSFAVRAFAVVD